MYLFHKIRNSLVLIAMLFAVTNIYSQELYEYTINEAVETYNEISGTQLYPYYNSDDGYAYVNMPFPFYWDNQQIYYIYAVTNGWLCMNNNYGSWYPYYVYYYPNMIAWHPCDLYVLGSMEYLVTGTPGRQVLTIQWKNIANYSPRTGSYNAQVKFYEGSNQVKIHYGPGWTNGINYTSWLGATGNNIINGSYQYYEFVNFVPGNPTQYIYGAPYGYDYYGRYMGPQSSSFFPSGKSYTFTTYPSLASATPANELILKRGYKYDAPVKPSVTIEGSYSNMVVEYSISGPLPATNPDFKQIYRAVVEGKPSVNQVPVGEGQTYFTEAVGIAANQSPSNDGVLDLLTNQNQIPGGAYLVKAKLILPDAGYEQELGEQTFIIALDNDLAVTHVQSPKSKADKKYPLSAGRIQIQAKVSNLGINSVSELYTIAEVFNVDGDQVYRDSVYWRDINNPITTGNFITVDFDNFRPRETGDFKLKIATTLLSASDMEPRNNIFPRETQDDFYFNVAYEIEAEAIAVVAPQGSTYVGRPVKPFGKFRNNGVSDISDVPGTMIITQLSTGDVVYTSNITIQDIPSGRNNEVIVPFDNDFIPPAAGEYKACVIVTSLDDPIRNNDTLCSTFEVTHALAGTYTVGNMFFGQERNFNTIGEALDAVYLQGLTGSVRFELTDDSYIVGSASDPLNPALDMSSSIVGLSAENTLTWTTHRSKAYTKGSVTINLSSASGIGIKIGQNDQPTNFNAPVHVVNESLKRQYSNSPGYIIFDGGIQKSLRFTMNTTNSFRAPFYLTQGASNITIKNCLITDGVNQVPSSSCMVPQMIFNSSTSGFQFMKDKRDNGETYSAGIVMRSVAPIDAKGEGNIRRLDTLVNSNNTIVDNEISNFGFGVVSLGTGVLFQQTAAKFTKYYNENNLIKNNYIHDVSRGGVFLGFESNTIVSGNRVHNVTGSCGYDAAGIIAGGGDYVNYFPYNNINLDINGNEISNVNSLETAYGVKLEQGRVTLQDPSGLPATFPDVPENNIIANNVIWGLNNNGNAATNIVGIHLFTQRMPNADWMTEMLTPMIPGYFTRQDKIVNNTILISNDGVTNTGAIAAVAIQNGESTVFYNNAIAIQDNSIDPNNPIASAVFYQGTMPGNYGVEADRNVYYFTGNVSSVYRFVEIDSKSQILDAGERDQFRWLNQWQHWTGAEANSVVTDFTNDLMWETTTPTSLMIKNNPYPLGSVLNNRGKRLDYVKTDIDGNTRGVAGQRFDIGAFEFNGRMNVTDVELISTPMPGNYMATTGEFSDAEYIMTEAPIEVMSRIRNNGSIQQSDINVRVRIYRQQPNGLYDMNTPELDHTVKATVGSGENTDVYFNLGDKIAPDFMPKTYADLRPDYVVPAKFISMEANVTPKYMIEVSVESDEDNSNNFYSKEVRFYLKKSGIKLLLTSENSNADLYFSGTPTADQIAGRLNADSLKAGMKKLGWYTNIDQGKFDVDYFDRMGWEPKAVNYNMYRTVIWTDGNEKPLTRYERLDLEDYVNMGTIEEKKNLIVGSQELVRLIDSRGNGYDVDFMRTVLRADYRSPGNPRGLDVDNDGNQVKGINVGRDLVENIASTSYNTDMPPYCGLMALWPEGEGLAKVGYEYVDHSANPSEATMAVAATTLSRNVIHLGVDWRHWSDMERLLRALLDFIENNGGTVVPVELTEFDAVAREKQVEISWATASELNSARFDIEKALKNETGISEFSKIRELDAAGTSSSRVDYGPVTDYDVEWGKTYIYRLRMVDLDGTSEISNEKEVLIGMIDGLNTTDGNNSFDLGEAIPNPATDKAKLAFKLGADANISIMLYDVSGKMVQSVYSGIMKAGSNSINVETVNLQAGSYRLVLKSGEVYLTRIINVVR